MQFGAFRQVATHSVRLPTGPLKTRSCCNAPSWLACGESRRCASRVAVTRRGHRAICWPGETPAYSDCTQRQESAAGIKLTWIQRASIGLETRVVDLQHAYLMTIDAQYRSPIVQTVRFHMAEPLDNILHSGKGYRRDMCLTKRRENPRARYVAGGTRFRRSLARWSSLQPAAHSAFGRSGWRRRYCALGGRRGDEVLCSAR